MYGCPVVIIVIVGMVIISILIILLSLSRSWSTEVYNSEIMDMLKKYATGRQFVSDLYDVAVEGGGGSFKKHSEGAKEIWSSMAHGKKLQST